MNGKVSPLYVDFFMRYARPVLGRDCRVLDYGCGDGKYLDFFQGFARPENVFGAEISNVRVERCRRLGWKNVVKVGKFEPLPFKDAFFDFINFDQVIEHIPAGEIPFYMKEFGRVLSNSGVILVMTPNYPIKRFYDVWNALQVMDLKKIKDDPTHVAKYNFKRLRSVASASFDEIRIEPTGGFLWNRVKRDFFSHKIIGLFKKRMQR